MSTGLNCEFIERQPGQWFYILEDGSAPKNAWDWKEYATAYGPFTSQAETNAHLSRHHANPGGYDVQSYDPKYVERPVVKQLLDEAPKNKERLDQSSTRSIRFRPYMGSW